MNHQPSDPCEPFDRRSLKTPVRLLAVQVALSANLALAQAMGQGLIQWAQPIILFLGLGAIVVALVGAVFRPQIVTSAVWAAVILAVVFFILRNANSMLSAIQS